MVRTQVYLTEAERDGLDAVARETNRNQSELIRMAVDQFLELAKGNHRNAVLREAAGMWGHRTDLRDLVATRRSWDRG